MVKSRTCFLHIPKSGGSSVISTLRSTLGSERLFHANESRYQNGPLQLLLNRYPIVAGHFSFAQISDVLLSNTFFFTFLRDPLDRVLSHYYYYRSREQAELYDSRVAAAQHDDIERFIDTLSDRPSPWSNWQTFVLSGATDSEADPEDLLPVAMRNLEKIDFVGIHDEVDEGFRRLCQLRRWPVLPSLPKVNVTADRRGFDEIPRAVLERLRELNDCDSKLFAHANAIWNERKGRGPSSMPMRIASPSAAPAATERKQHGTREIVFTNIAVRAEPARPDGRICENDRVVIQLRGRSDIDARDLTVGIRISDDIGLEVYGVNTHQLGTPIAVAAGKEFEVDFQFDMRLAAGTYHLTTAIHAGDDHLHKCYHWIDNALAIECKRAEGSRFSGLVNLKAHVTVQSLVALAAIATAI